ncbi:hypothetical protein [Meiothermus taiwanensis]|nr:hypothetical protein [Meiothermus taiwanensis]
MVQAQRLHVAGNLAGGAVGELDLRCLAPDRQRLVPEVCMQAADALFDLALKREREAAHRAMDELKRLLLGYLEPLDREAA